MANRWFCVRYFHLGKEHGFHVRADTYQEALAHVDSIKGTAQAEDFYVVGITPDITETPDDAPIH